MILNSLARLLVRPPVSRPFSNFPMCAALGAFVLFAGCSSPTNPALPVGSAAYDEIPPASPLAVSPDYLISAGDVLSITVFQEPELSFDQVRVDASGNIVFPLIGEVRAAGNTALQVSQIIAAQLNANFLVDPQVSLFVTEASGQIVTVEGAVEIPGVYPLNGSSNLLQTMALARGPTSTAQLNEIIVFRTRGEEVYAAQFDLSLIRVGLQPNPEIVAGDIVVVGNSALRGVLRQLLITGPALAAVFVRVL